MTFGGDSKQKDAKYNVLSGNIFPNGDLSKPVINDRYTGGGGYVYFGTDNLYPDLITQMYYISPLHRAICDFKRSSVCGNGFTTELTGTTATEKIKEAAVINIIKKNFKQLTLDNIIHARFYLKLTFNEKGELQTANRIDPTMVRHDRSDIYGKINTVFIKRDWSQGSGVDMQPVMKRGHLQKECIFMYQAEAPGVLTYTVPGYATAANWMFLDGEISYLHKSNILNSINPSYILNFPKQPANKQEMEKIKDQLETKGQGAKNAGRVITLFSLNRDQMPDVITAPVSQNDKLFSQTSKDLRDSICFAHSINPSIVGIKTAGQLGNSEELKTSYQIFDKTVIEPMQETMEDYFDTLLDICNISGSVKLIGTKIEIE